MKQLIEFEEEKFNKEFERLKTVVSYLNKGIPILSEYEEVTLELIYKMATDANYIRIERYQNKIKELCDKFYLKFEEVATFLSEHFILDMAQGAIQYLFKARNEMNIYSKDGYLLTDEYIIIDNGIAKITPNAEEILREKHSYYIENKRELEIFEKMTEVNKLLNAVSKKYGYKSIKDISSYNTNEKKFTINKNLPKVVANQNR